MPAGRYDRILKTNLIITYHLHLEKKLRNIAAVSYLTLHVE